MSIRVKNLDNNELSEYIHTYLILETKKDYCIIKNVNISKNVYIFSYNIYNFNFRSLMLDLHNLIELNINGPCILDKDFNNLVNLKILT